MALRLALLAFAVVVLAGCGGSKHAATKVAGGGTTTTSCHTKAQTRALARLHHDLVVLKAAGRVPVKNKLLGGKAINRATDRFINDLVRAPISSLTKNRLIDHAATYAVANCQQCFQAFEAARPIPSIAHDSNGASCYAKP